MTAQLSLEEFVFAIASVSSATAAARTHGDLKTAAVLAEYYALVAEAVGPSGGCIVKAMGDGVLIVFPPTRAKEAVAVLRDLQTQTTPLWSELDARCRTQVRVGAGPLVSGAMGPPGDERFDVYGTALNDLFKAPPGDFVMTPELAERLASPERART